MKLGRGVWRGKTVMLAVCGGQAIVASAVAAVFYGVGGFHAALAALYGGLVAIVPAVYFGMRVLAPRAELEPQQVVGAFYRGELGKLALTALLFFVGIAWLAQWFLPLIVSFIACQLVYWVALAVLRVA